MTKRKRISKTTVARIAAGAAAGLSRRQLVSMYPNASEGAIRVIMRENVDSPEWRRIQAEEWRTIATEATQKLAKAIRDDKVSPNSLALNAAIATDKAQALEAANLMAAPLNQTVNFFGMTKEQLLDQLDGPNLLKPRPFLGNTGVVGANDSTDKSHASNPPIEVAAAESLDVCNDPMDTE
jgi:hypothetical protein